MKNTEQLNIAFKAVLCGDYFRWHVEQSNENVREGGGAGRVHKMNL